MKLGLGSAMFAHTVPGYYGSAHFGHPSCFSMLDMPAHLDPQTPMDESLDWPLVWRARARARVAPRATPWPTIPYQGLYR